MVASGWAVAAAPCTPQAAERLAKSAPSMRSPNRTSGRFNVGCSAAAGAASDGLAASRHGALRQSRPGGR